MFEWWSGLQGNIPMHSVKPLKTEQVSGRMTRPIIHRPWVKNYPKRRQNQMVLETESSVLEVKPSRQETQK